jgi:beta-lysine 5,6-aminomutase alpha subunit
MLTEALHTPLLQDRWLAIDQARAIRKSVRHLAEEVQFRPDGRIIRRAREVLEGAERILERIAGAGLFQALADGVFAQTRRPRDRGRGAEGVVRRAEDYSNPFLEVWAGQAAGAAR